MAASRGATTVWRRARPPRGRARERPDAHRLVAGVAELAMKLLRGEEAAHGGAPEARQCRSPRALALRRRRAPFSRGEGRVGSGWRGSGLEDPLTLLQAPDLRVVAICLLLRRRFCSFPVSSVTTGQADPEESQELPLNQIPEMWWSFV
uniref:Uncharacterized protein n=1 Tax=Ananas comosus var. bracteatus TaxID=296719 RepID=A0A6V7QKH7_ANACO|nr:unnamed protein product [Ananas comosus var. bracteatus]